MIRIPGRTNFRNKFQIQQDLVLIDLSFIPQYITYVGIKSEAEQQNSRPGLAWRSSRIQKSGWKLWQIIKEITVLKKEISG